MHVFYGIHTLTTWLDHEEGLISTQTYFDAEQILTEHFKSERQKSLISFNIVTTLLILQKIFQLPPTMSLLCIVLIVNLSAKSN